jgi:hypothetical protein
MTTTLPTSTVELDHRVNDGIDVRLFWSPEDGRVLVSVADFRTGDDFTLEVADRSRALDVFNHPYAYRGETSSTREALTEAAAP